MYYLSITEYTIIYLCLFMLKKIKKESINTIYIYIYYEFIRQSKGHNEHADSRAFMRSRYLYSIMYVCNNNKFRSV